MITLEDIKVRMAKLNDWALDGSSIVKDIMLPDFKAAIEFVNKVGEIAEKENHHPLIFIDYNHVRLSLTSHDAGGVSEKDFDMAEEIDKIL